MTREFYDMLIKSAAEASQRARWIFTVAIVISLLQLGPAYNFGFGELRSYVEKLVYDKAGTRQSAAGGPGAPRLRDEKSTERSVERTTTTEAGKATESMVEKIMEVTSTKPLQAESPTRSADAAAALQELRKAVITSWVDQQTIEVLGLKFHIADASFIGAVAFIVVTLWLFYAVRRENHLFGRILQMAGKEPREMQTYVFHALNSTQIFATLSEDDRPYTSVEFHPRSPEVQPVHGNRIAAKPPPGAKAAFAVRPLAAALTYLPTATLGWMLLIDLLSVFYFNAVFRGYEGSLNEMHQGKVFVRENAGYFVGLVFQVLALCLVGSFSLRIRRLQLGTQFLLREASDRGWAKTPQEEDGAVPEPTPPPAAPSGTAPPPPHAPPPPTPIPPGPRSSGPP